MHFLKFILQLGGKFMLFSSIPLDRSLISIIVYPLCDVLNKFIKLLGQIVLHMADIGWL